MAFLRPARPAHSQPHAHQDRFSMRDLHAHSHQHSDVDAHQHSDTDADDNSHSNPDHHSEAHAHGRATEPNLLVGTPSRHDGAGHLQPVLFHWIAAASRPTPPLPR